MKTRDDVQQLLLDRASEDETFRALLLQDPRRAILDLTGIDVPSDVKLTVHEEGTKSFHLVVPASDRLTEGELAAVSGGADTGHDPGDASPY